MNTDSACIMCNTHLYSLYGIFNLKQSSFGRKSVYTPVRDLPISYKIQSHRINKAFQMVNIFATHYVQNDKMRI